MTPSSTPTGTLQIKVRRANGTESFEPLNLEHRVRLSDNPWLAKGNRNIILTDAPQNQQHLEALRKQGSVWPTDAVETFVVRHKLNDEGANPRRRFQLRSGIPSVINIAQRTA